MEELALKPVGKQPQKVDYSALEQNSLVRSVLTYNYGENVSKWAVIKPFTFGGNHYNTSSILNIFDGDGSTYYAIANSAAANSTTTITFDFNRQLEIRGTIVSMAFVNKSAGDTFTTSYSLDGINFITLETSTYAAGTEYHDHVTALAKIRAFRISLTTANIGGDTRIFHFAVVV